MNAEQRFAERLKQYEHDPEFLTEELLIEITEQISVRLDAIGMSAAELAKRLGVSRPYISQIMNGKPNMTIRTLVGIALALDQRVSVTLKDRRKHGLDVGTFTYAVPTITAEHHDGEARDLSRESAIAA